jgi:hypothetical protein
MRWVKVHICVVVLPVTGLIVTIIMSSLRLHFGGINQSIESPIKTALSFICPLHPTGQTLCSPTINLVELDEV